jgi:hypothetical protein
MTERPVMFTFGEMRDMGVRGVLTIALTTGAATRMSEKHALIGNFPSLRGEAESMLETFGANTPAETVPMSAEPKHVFGRSYVSAGGRHWVADNDTLLCLGKRTARAFRDHGSLFLAECRIDHSYRA